MTRLLILIPCRPDLHADILARSLKLAHAIPQENPTLDCMIVHDYRAEPKHSTDVRPWSVVARVRNKLLATLNLSAFDYVMWIDADVVNYQPDLPTKLIEAAGGGIAAPMVFVEGTERFYDPTAFIIAGRSDVWAANKQWMHGRNLMPDAPHWPQQPSAEIVAMDCVGTCYVISTSVYHFIFDDFHNGAHFDHPAFTDHFCVCETARNLALPVVVHRGLRIDHANLPKHGEKWH